MENALTFYNKEFEKVVRSELLIDDRPIYPSDVINVTVLDLFDFWFDIRDCETLCFFKNLERLDIELSFKDLSFLASFPKLNDLYIVYSNSVFDFKYLPELKALETLTVSGGDWSSMSLKNLEFIADIDNLQELILHEFGDIDLRPLQKMQHLKHFYCGFAGKIYNYNAIAKLVNLEELTLIDVQMDNADFLQELPRTMILDMCGVEFTEDIDINIFDKFADKDISEIVINGKRVLFEGDSI